MGRVLCFECGKILESKSVHDFVRCDCPNQTSVDGGDFYCRMGGMDLTKVKPIISDKEFCDGRAKNSRS